MTPLQLSRLKYALRLPKSLKELSSISFCEHEGPKGQANHPEIAPLFKCTFNQPFLIAKHSEPKAPKALKVGAFFSGGQAPGGHNVITGLFDALKKLHPDSELFGFLNGPAGLIEGKFIPLTEKLLLNYRNQGGFDLIGSGRTKIESDEQIASALAQMTKLQLDGFVIIGGDDSNTNAALLAECALAKGLKTRIIGVPKTIDGDLKHPYIETSFGFHTATAIYSELIGNICRDALSAKKYTHFIKLMGRSASHIALECALNTQPNLTLIGEEILKKGMTLQQLTQQIADLVEARAHIGKNYGVILIPEGIIEFIPEVKELIGELNHLLAEGKDERGLQPKSKVIFDFLPEKIQKQLLLDRDPHGNVQLSHIQTESLLSEKVKEELKGRTSFKGAFHPVHHFFGYEGRSGFPSNFDATYCYVLGHGAALLIQEGKTGYLSSVLHLSKPPEEWELSGVPLTSMMHFEIRKGKKKPVIQKALLDLQKAPFTWFEKEREKWRLEDHYMTPGPIQFEGEQSLAFQIPKSLEF